MGQARLLPGGQSKVSASSATPLTLPLSSPSPELEGKERGYQTEKTISLALGQVTSAL